ncbi:DUF2589 domain-containing protein [Nocardia vaccinii]|uniref:DUF2589 domain-containing protein n=1 Tax=Nocardia vaccinii TaxID=1822 RepID=UPI00082F6817|nr:DUF2589 domain-containing protein [Nocardia vaccinii]
MAIGQEISSLDFSAMIGGPLIAVVKAQAQSAQATADFVRKVGFTADGKLETMSFSYYKNSTPTDAKGTTSDLTKIDIPVLTMLPIPCLRIQETVIDFNAKINSVEETQTTSSSDLSVDAQAKAGWGPFSAKLKASYSHKSSNSQGQKVERQYGMSVNVKAVQDELPAGLDRLLSLLEGGIGEGTAQAAPSDKDRTGPRGTAST